MPAGNPTLADRPDPPLARLSSANRAADEDEVVACMLNAHDAFHLRNSFLNIPFDTERQRDRRGGTPDASTLQANGDDTLRIHIDELDVSAVGLNQGSDLIQDGRHATTEGFRAGTGVLSSGDHRKFLFQ